MRLGWTAYIVPFLFMFSPALLLQSGSTIETVVAIATAIIGVWLISAGMVGYLAGPMVLWLRIGFVLSGICLLIPDQIADWAFWTDMTGAIAGGLMVACQVLLRPGKSRAPAATSGDV